MQNFVRGGDTIIFATSDYPFLSAYAARRTNGTLSLLVINKSSLNTLTANIAISGYQASSNADVYSFGLPQDEAARTGVGSPDIAQTNFTAAGTNFTTSFAPYSLTVLSLTPAPPRLLVPSAVTNGQFHFQILGQSGVRYIVQSSPDLFSWSPYSTNSVTNSAIVDLHPTNEMRFYRAVWTP